MRVSYQGIAGSYSECAARQLGYEPVSCVTFTDAANMVEEGKVDMALLPIENSTEGGVGEVNDILFHTNLRVVGEAYYHIRHCLIGTGDIDTVETIYSHPQALGQCRKFVGGVEQVPVYDTAGAVAMVRDMYEDGVAAIAGREAAEIHNMPVIVEDINDIYENYTHFLILGWCAPLRTDGESKTTITFTLRHQPGALHMALHTLRGLNLTRIESRPQKTGSFEYVFSVDFVGHIEDAEVQDALANLRDNTTTLRVLGSYERKPVGG